MIFVLGDSFGSGSELADHLLPSWPGHKDPSPNLKRYQDWQDERGNLEGQEIMAKIGKNIFQEIMAKNSWPGQLQDIANIEVINKSRAKTGPSYWPFALSSELRELKKINKTPSTVILQFSSIDREMLYTTEDRRILPQFINAGMLTNSGPETDYFVSMKLLENSVANFYRFLCTVLISQDICRANGVTDIHVVSTHDVTRTLVNPIGGWTVLENYPDITYAMQNTGIDWHNIDCIEQYSTNRRGELPGGHFDADTSGRFSRMLAKKYFNVNTV